MGMLEFYQSNNIFVDLALEAHELLRGAAQKEIPGVSEEKEYLPEANITTIKILNEIGERIMGRTRGTYITIEAPRLRENNRQVHKEISNILARKLQELILSLGIAIDAPILLMGLGNWEATPDALGPRVIDQCLVTRHLFKYAPEELQGGLRSVSAMAPGVLGITGIETAEIIRGVVDRTHPSLVIAIDALAAQNLNRVSTTIQLADTGISPGSGVGNQQADISHAFLGIPVIAIGIPTVVHAAVIIFEAMQQLVSASPNLTAQLGPTAMQGTAQAVLAPFGGDLTVTPKEVDDLIDNVSRVIAAGINQGVHPSIQPDDFATYLG